MLKKYSLPWVFGIKVQPSGLPIFTFAMAASLILAYFFSTFDPTNFQSEIKRINYQHEAGYHIAKILMEYCDFKFAQAETCESDVKAAAIYILGRRYPDGINERATHLTEAFFQHEMQLSKLPGYGEFTSGWNAEKEGLNQLAQSENILLGKKWGLFASVKVLWLHGFPFHIGLNVLMLLIFGALVERRTSRTQWLCIYLGSGILASLLFVSHFHHDLSITIGASQAISGLAGWYVAWVLSQGRWRTLSTWIFNGLPIGLALYMTGHEALTLFTEPKYETGAAALHIFGFSAGLAFFVLFFSTSVFLGRR
ncbi:MAG: rhomboid family intramembrane serine protease [Bacteriovoracia bacterium]